MTDATPRDEAGHKPTVYLAGPVAHVDDGGAGWREHIESRFGKVIETRNPLDKYNIPLEELDVVPGDDSGRGEVSVGEIVTNDKRLIRESDAILVGYEAVQSVGTPMEVHYAFRRGYPVALWLRDDTDPDELSPWYRHHVSAITDSAELAVDHIRREVDDGG